jgi:hypothetical protein
MTASDMFRNTCCTVNCTVKSDVLVKETGHKIVFAVTRIRMKIELVLITE